MSTNELLLLDNARRLLWVFDVNFNLEFQSKNPFIEEEKDRLLKEKSYLKNFIKNNNKIFKSNVFKYVSDKSNYRITIIEESEQRIELRSVILDRKYKWTNLSNNENYIKIEITSDDFEVKSGYLIIHSLGIIYGEIITCDDINKIKLKDFVVNKINENFKFNY